jgi:hypothetical protein
VVDLANLNLVHGQRPTMSTGAADRGHAIGSSALWPMIPA